MIFGPSFQTTRPWDKQEEKEDPTPLPPDDERCNDLKNHLRSLLDRYDGSTKHEDVIDAIGRLSTLSPYTEHSPVWLDLFMGEFFAQTSPNFPGRLPPAHEGDTRVQYTLGKLSFNTFHPSDLVCTLLGVRNVIAPKSDGTFTYDLICDIIIHHEDGDIEAQICNESYCCKDDDESNRVHVFFTGSKLSPAPAVIENEVKMSQWSNTFNEATLKTAAAERTYFGWFLHQLLKRMLGMNVRVGESNSFHLTFKKPFQGHIDVLYLDEEMRITKGNRGTLVVVERLH
ncbi:unnamed protein product [Cylindrotheca closterium]|uniref:Plastid lipid-associated protein/fibrillin conserved domain-containing protein n=1 Tax=Cylindrotheca closterium TaxID=2856 RepID=A0AAD2CGX3_9STRA|nr:unnamed protein product [Cylindrotheca closterium]